MLHATAHRIASKINRKVTLVEIVTWSVGIFSAIVAVVFVGTVIHQKLKSRSRGLQNPEHVMKADAKMSGEASAHVRSERADTTEPPFELKAHPEIAPAFAVPASGPGGIKNIEAKQGEIVRAVEAFFAARTVTELLPLVRDARRVRLSIEQYYAARPFETRTWKDIGWIKPVEEPGYRLAYVQARFVDASPINVVVEETDVGFLIDWESSVLYSEMGWHEFQSIKPRESTAFRVLASSLGASLDSNRGGKSYVFLMLKHPSEDGILVGRYDPLEPRYRPLVDQLDLCHWKDAPVIVRLKYVGDSKLPNEVEIDAVEGKGWVILGPARE